MRRFAVVVGTTGHAIDDLPDTNCNYDQHPTVPLFQNWYSFESMPELVARPLASLTLPLSLAAEAK